MKRIPILLSLIVIFSLTNCSTFENDYLFGLDFGASETAWKKKLTDLVKSGELTEETDQNGTDYKIKLPLGSDKSYEAYVWMNGNYEFGELRELNYAFGRSLDRKLKESEIRPIERYNSEEIQNIYSNLISQYGKPDSLNIGYYYEFIALNSKNDTIKSNPELTSRNAFGFFNKPKQILDSVQVPPDCPKIFAIWNHEEYQIEFAADPKRYFDTWEYPYYPSSYLNFKSNSFDKILSRIEDSVKVTLKPADIISISPGKVEWEEVHDNSGYDYTLNIHFSNPTRPWTLEKRDVTNILVDFILTDNFDKELAKITDFDIELDRPLSNGHGFMTQQFVTLTYDDSRSENRNYEQARIHDKSFDVRSKAIIKGVRFSDGSILKN